MCGGPPRILRTPRLGAPAAGNNCQSMRRAWWGPRVDNARAQAMKLFDNVDAATLQTESRSYVIRAHELEIGPPLDPPVRNEMGNYDRREHKAAEQTRAMEWNSIPAGLPFSPEGIWPAPKNEEEYALCRAKADCAQLRPPATHSAFRSCSTSTPLPRAPLPVGSRAEVTHSAMATGPS